MEGGPKDTPIARNGSHAHRANTRIAGDCEVHCALENTRNSTTTTAKLLAWVGDTVAKSRRTADH